MSGFQPPYPPLVAGTEDSPVTSPSEVQYNPQQSSSQLGNPGALMSNPYQSLGYFTGFPDPIMFQAPKTQSTRSRKKSIPGMEHVKHRRTRSGCYMCRSRRVKCDETRPVCERCRKGKRDCIYPEATSSKGPSGSGPSRDVPQSHATSPGSSQDDSEDFEMDAKLEPILDEVEPEDALSRRSTGSFRRLRRAKTISTLNLRRAATRHSSETPSLDGAKSSSTSASTGTAASLKTHFQVPEPPFQRSVLRPDWSHLPVDLQSRLRYFYDNISHYDYCLPNDPDDFFRTILPNFAINSGNDALTYALVAFSTYHSTVKNPNGQIEDFLHYYDNSVTCLLDCFKRGEQHNISTLMAILQLATIEEYLGNWVNLSGHQRGALEILTQLYTPPTAMQSPTSRMLVSWYGRFDVILGMMGGFGTTLPREWFATVLQSCQEHVANNPDNLAWRIEVHAAEIRLLSADMSNLYAKGGRGDMSGQSFAAEHGRITRRLHEWRKNLDPAVTDAAFLVTNLPQMEQPDESAIVDPYQPGFLYSHPLFSTTILMVEWHSIIVMHKSQEASALLNEPPQELQSLALIICQIYETMQLWPSTPNGALVTVHASLAIAALFLPRDDRHHMWIRRKYAQLEGLGYIFPTTMRTRMAELFRDPSCTRWWLPRDEGFYPVIRKIRAFFADERNTNAVSRQARNIHEMSAIFDRLRMGSDETTPSPVEASGSSLSFLRGGGTTPRG
ncbi:hypothetical protein GGR56DRAFT_348350 [Xylariaceae sp. FL0804]|nr:hypothetical protein GGR56DRAFT_348350 [Xylariaceae sp. FL0804]